MTSYYDRYMRDLQNVMRLRMLMASQGRSVARPGPQDIALDAVSRAKFNPVAQVTSVPEAPKGPGGILGFMKKALPFASPGTYALVEGADTSPGRAIIDLLSRGVYASANAQLETEKMRAEGKDVDSLLGLGNKELASRQIKGFVRGLTGEDKTTYADVARFKDPDGSNLGTAAEGLAKDIALDPLTYLPVAGAISALGKLTTAGKTLKATEKLIKPAENAVETATKTGVAAGDQQTEVTKLLTMMGKNVDETKPVPEKLTVEPTNIESVLDTARADALFERVRHGLVYQHPRDLDIPAPFKDIEVKDEPIKLPDVTAKPELTSKQKSTLGQLRGVKANLLQQEDYMIGKFTVGSLLSAARKTKDPARLKYINKMFDDEAKRLLKSGEYKGLARAQLYGRSGEKAAFGLTQDELADLFTRGEIGGNLGAGYKVGTDKFTRQFPIHSEDDLDQVFLNNARGQRVSLRQYLGELGVGAKSVLPSGKSIDVNLPEVKPFSLEAVVTKKTVPFDDAESVAWIAQAKGRLSDEEVTYLREAKSRKDFSQRLDKLKSKVISGDFESLDTFLTAAEAGMIPKTTLEEVFKIAGVKNIKGLKAKVSEILNKTGEAKPAQEVLKEGAPKTNPKVQRIKGRVDPNDFGPVVKAEDIVKSGVDVKRQVPKLNEDQLQDLAHALPWSILENLVDPADIKKYPFLTDIKKAKRTSATPGAGRARNIHGWNAMSQADVFRGLIRSASRRYPVARTLKGKEARNAWVRRSDQLYQDVMPTLKAAETALQSSGVKIVSGKDNAGIMLTLHDVLSSLPEEVVKRYLFMPRSSALPTDFLDAADGIIRARFNHANVPLDVAHENAINIFRHSPKIKTLRNADVVARNLADLLMDHSDAILQKVEANYAVHGLEVGKYVKSMTDEVIQNVVTKYADPNVSIGEALGDFAMRQEDISKIGRSIKAPTEAYDAAKDSTNITLATVLNPGDFAEAQTTKQMASATTQQQVAKIGAKQSESRSSEALDLIEPTVDLGERFQAQLATNLFRANVPLLDKAYTLKDVLGRGFVASYGHADLHEALRVERSVTQDFSRMHRGLIAQIHDSAHQAVGADAGRYLKEAFVHLQHGTKPADEVMQGFVDALKSSADLTFGSSVDNIGSFAQRNGLFPKHLNEVLDYYNAPKKYRFDPDKTWAEQANAWRQWENVDDPLTLLDMMHAAVQRATVETTLGRDFSVKFGVAKPQAGYVKVTNKGDKSKIGRFIDQDLYYPREIVEQMKYLDNVLNGTLSGIKNPTAKEVIRLYDSVIHSWKSGLTIYRPGHHVRNLIGDMTLSMFDGVVNPNSYRKSMAILATRSKAYQGWEGLKALETGTPLAGASDNGILRVTAGGKKLSLNYDQVWRAAFDQGIIPDYRTLEDIAFNTKQSIQFKAGKGVSLTRPLGGRGQRIAGGVSQSRDHMVRIAHFVDVLQKGRFKTLEEAFDQAGRRVRKWHPDGSDLTNFENKVMRRTFMFYSWMRKAIPLVVETLVMQPGKAMIFPKAMYAFAEMNGVDLDSLGNPFPVDQLFPEFITDQVLGPQFGETGDYGGINPGEPVTELLSQWGTSQPQHGIGGALTPALRIPIELYTGDNLGTGTNINDMSDYVDSQIPGVGYVARATGRSVTGLGAPTRDVARGYVEPGFNDEAFINFLTGLGIRDYSKPNYIRRAQLEKREEAREQYRRQNG